MCTVSSILLSSTLIGHNMVFIYIIISANQAASDDTINTRAMIKNRPIEIGASALMSKTCISDAIKLCDNAPEELKYILLFPN